MSLFIKAMRNFYKISSKIIRTLSFLHIKICIVIFITALVMLMSAFLLDYNDVTFWSSICANIFAGLITGLVICFISGSKQMKIVTLQIQKKWLEDINSLLKKYIVDYQKLCRLNFEKYSTDDDNLFAMIYEVGVNANEINSMILQGKFDKTISFDPVVFSKKKLGYDAQALIKSFDKLRDNLYLVDVNSNSAKEIVAFFDDVHPHLQKLKLSVYSTLMEVDIYLAEINRTMI